MVSVFSHSIHFTDFSNHFYSMKNNITKTKGDRTRRREIVGLVKAGQTDTDAFYIHSIANMNCSPSVLISSWYTHVTIIIAFLFMVHTVESARKN